MAYWLLKTEPEAYSFEDLERESRTVWDGVRNNLALKQIRAVRKSDRALIYHTGNERAAVGVARVVSNPYPDPEGDDDRFVVFDLAPEGRLDERVTLKRIKEDEAFQGFDLVRLPRLSVVPVPERLWRRLIALGGGIEPDG